MCPKIHTPILDIKNVFHFSFNDLLTHCVGSYYFVLFLYVVSIAIAYVNKITYLFLGPSILYTGSELIDN